MTTLRGLLKRVWALLPFGAAGDERCPGPPYHVDPGTRMIHSADCRWRNKTEYTYSTLKAAIEAGGNPCWTCLRDWEERIEKEGG